MDLPGWPAERQEGEHQRHLDALAPRQFRAAGTTARIYQEAGHVPQAGQHVPVAASEQVAEPRHHQVAGASCIQGTMIGMEQRQDITRQAAQQLRAILEQVRSGELEASARLVVYLEGVITGLDAASVTASEKLR